MTAPEHFEGAQAPSVTRTIGCSAALTLRACSIWLAARASTTKCSLSAGPRPTMTVFMSSGGAASASSVRPSAADDTRVTPVQHVAIADQR